MPALAVMLWARRQKPHGNYRGSYKAHHRESHYNLRNLRKVIRQNHIVEFPPPQNNRKPSQSEDHKRVRGPRPIAFYHIKNIIGFPAKRYFFIFYKSENDVGKILNSPRPPPLLFINIFHG